MHCISTPTSQHRFSRGTKCSWVALFELCMTVLAALALYSIAEPLLSTQVAAGLNARYGANLTQGEVLQFINYLTVDQWRPVSNDMRSMALLQYSSYWLCAFTALGWLGLTLSRTNTPWVGGLIVAIWCCIAWITRPFGTPGEVWLVCMMAGCLISLACALTRWPKVALAKTGAYTTYWSAWVWPGWILLTGIGWLWIADFAARGPISEFAGNLKPGARYFGLRQADGLWLANGILLSSSLYRDRIVIFVARACTSLQAVWIRPRGPIILAIGGVALAFGFGLMGHNANHPLNVWFVSLSGAGKPHISGEILRLAGCVSIAWFIYRNGEWNAPARRVWHSLKGLSLALLLCGLGFVVSSDMGPLLILFMVTLLLIAVPLLHSRHQPSLTRSVLTAIFACVLTVGGMELWKTAISEWAPAISNTAAEREFARQMPFSASSPNLAQVRWLLDSAPFQEGFGLARVPYCGASAAVGLAPCSLASGAPIQLPSDFAFAGIAATWGMLGGGILVLISIAWLCILPIAALAAIDKEDGAPAWSLLHVWLIALACLAAQAQTIISVGGTLTWSPLSGVALPLLGYGATSLCVCALWIGIAANPLGAVHGSSIFPASNAARSASGRTQHQSS